MNGTDQRARRSMRYAFALALVLALPVCGRVQAQVFVGVTPYGPYFGWGNAQGNQLDNYLAQQGIARGQAAEAQRNRAMASFDNSNAYYNHVREPTYLGRYDATSRRRVEDESLRRATDAIRPPKTAEGEKRVPPTTRPLADYFDRSDVLVWPADSPTDGDLGTKRDVSNRASLAVLMESRERGVARIATVTTARTRLLDYGRPALELLRNRTTPAVSELFHAFLLGLYDSLELAATPQPGPSR